jgi:predicted amidophosphoribosyltransferase
LCRDCRTALEARLASASSAPANVVASRPGPLDQLEWCGPFDGITRRVLERLSAAGERRVSGPLGTAIANRWASVGSGGDALVPVPAPADRIREIGYDPADLLARVAGRRLGVPVAETLVRIPSTEAAGGPAFVVSQASRITGRSLVLVDDVVVTGTTLATCAAALLDAGARMVSAVTVARDHRGMPAKVSALVRG